MLGILIFSWIVSVLLVLLAERNNGYSSSLSHDEKIKRMREKRRKLEQEMAARAAKRKEEHRIWMELMGFAKEEEKKKLIKTSYNIVFFRAYINATFGSQTKSSIFYGNNSNFRDHFNFRLCSLEYFAYICGITN